MGIINNGGTINNLDKNTESRLSQVEQAVLNLTHLMTKLLEEYRNSQSKSQ
jgi:hypothetical protein